MVLPEPLQEMPMIGCSNGSNQTHPSSHTLRNHLNGGGRGKHDAPRRRRPAVLKKQRTSGPKWPKVGGFPWHEVVPEHSAIAPEDLVPRGPARRRRTSRHVPPASPGSSGFFNSLGSSSWSIQSWLVWVSRGGFR